MKKFISNKKTKIISAILASILIVAISLTFASSFFKSNSNNSLNENDENYFDEYTTINIINSIKKQNLTLLLDEINNTFFSQQSIETNIYKILKQSIDQSNDWKNENIDDYSFKIRYKLDENRKNLQLNLFLYNKLIKNKKYKSSLMIEIV